MKIKTGRTVEKAVREFTDREAPRASFWKKYHAVEAELGKDANVHVLTYYGIGGIGKTSLVKKLMREMDKQLPSPVYVYLDFGISPDIRRNLYSLKCKLQETARFTFPLLELGLYIYAKKVGEKADSPEVRQLTDRSPLLSLLLSVSENIPVLDIATKVVNLVDKGATFLQNYLKMHSKELTRIEYMEPEALYEYLPMLFALDIQHNMRDAKTPVVFFLDTYEQLVNEMSQLGDPLKNDEWIRSEEGLVQNIPGVLWVITGREKLKWERFDPEWADALEQHLLGSLSMADSVQFLERAGIEPRQLREQLYDLTQGTPVFLDLCVDQYLRLLERGITPQIDLFGRNTYDLTERFIRYMGDMQKDHVYFLACLGSWTPELIDGISQSVLPNFSITTLEKVKDYSFVVPSDENHYQMQRTVGDVLLKACPEVIQKRTGQALLNRFLGIVRKKAVYHADFADALLYTARGGLLYHTDREALCKFYLEQLEGPLDAFVDAGQFRQAKRILALLTNVANEQKTDGFYAAIMYANSRCQRLSGDYTGALEYAREAYRVYAALGGADDAGTIKAMGNVAILLGALGHHAQALELKAAALEKRRRMLGEEDLRTLWAMQNLAVTLGALGRHEEALALQQEVLCKRRRILGEDHPDTVWAMLNLTVTLRALGDFGQARQLQEAVLAQRCRIFGENHPDTLWAMHNLMLTLSDLGEWESAAALGRQLLEKRRLILGEGHPDTVLAMKDLIQISQEAQAATLEQDAQSKT